MAYTADLGPRASNAAVGRRGIIPFELAGSAARTEQLMHRWGSDGKRAARWSLRLDFGYMLTTAHSLLCRRTAPGKFGHPPEVALAVIPAVVADAVEGVCLLKVLEGDNVEPQR